MKKLNVIFLALIALMSVTSSSHATTVEHDGRYIYYRSSWVELSKADQVEVVDDSVNKLKNEISSTLSQTTGLKTLSNSIIDSGSLDKLTQEAQQSVTTIDSYNYRNLLPKALLLYGGISGGAGFIGQLKLSGDLGIVVLPSKVTRVDVENNTSTTYFELAWNLVVVPHVYAGVGVGAGATASVGVGLIFGEMDKPEDFGGTVLSASGAAMFVGGVDFEGSVVYNHSAGKVFGLAIAEMDFGAEASAGLDGEAGEIMSVADYVKFFSSGQSTSGTSDIALKNPSASVAAPTTTDSTANADSTASTPAAAPAHILAPKRN